MRYTRSTREQSVGGFATNRMTTLPEVRMTLIQVSWRRLGTALLLSFVAYFVLGGALEAVAPSAGVELDHLIPRERWSGTGLDKLTAPEQQTLADEITGLLAAARSTQNSAPATKDKSQWRMLKRGMSKDDVRKLLGDPDRVSVSRFFESWSFGNGTVTFNGKDHVDFWSEP
jgi:hypothetical protein